MQDLAVGCCRAGYGELLSVTKPVMDRPPKGTQHRCLEEATESLDHYRLPHSKSSETKYPDYCRTMQVRDANGGIKELVFPKALDLDRPKRARTTFSAEQLYHLEREFQRNQYLVGRERTDLAQKLHLSETQVKVWFQNRRTKYKRDRVREAEVRNAKAESIAACNILRILQEHQPVPRAPPLTVLTPQGRYSN